VLGNEQTSAVESCGEIGGGGSPGENLEREEDHAREKERMESDR
jgi:hypothetical protein